MKYLNINTIKPYEKNPRKNASAIDAVAKSIKSYGFQQPIVVDRNNTVIAGHTRLGAAKKLGLTEVPVVIADKLSEREVNAYRIADNKTHEFSEWDDELLQLELQDLGDLYTGFEPIELGGQDLGDEDDCPDIDNSQVITQLGDVWKLDQHRLICGDSTNSEQVSKLLAGQAPHLMVTDPPYGVNYDANWRNEVLTDSNRAVGEVKNDNLVDWSKAWQLFPGDVAYVWHASLFGGTVAESLLTNDFELRSQIIWAKNHFAISRGDYHWQHESCYYAVKKGKPGRFVGDRKQTTLWHIDKPLASETGYSTQKPVACMQRPIENNSNKGQIIYDPFLGSGTTIIAAENTGRICYGVELNPKYCDVIVQRWEDYTGKKAEKLM